MVGDGQVLLHFRKLVRQDHIQRVFLPVNRLLLQRGIDLGEGQRRGVGAQRLDPVDIDGVGDHAQLEAGDIFHGVDGPLAVGEVAKAELEISQADDVLVGQLGVQLLTQRAVDHGIRFFGVGKHEGEVIDLKVLHLRSQDAGVEQDKFDGAALQRRDIGRVTTQRATGEDIHFQLAAAFGCHQISKLFGTRHQRVALGVLQRELEGALLDLRKSAAAASQGQGCGDEGAASG